VSPVKQKYKMSFIPCLSRHESELPTTHNSSMFKTNTEYTPREQQPQESTASSSKPLNWIEAQNKHEKSIIHSPRHIIGTRTPLVAQSSSSAMDATKRKKKHTLFLRRLIWKKKKNSTEESMNESEQMTEEEQIQQMKEEEDMARKYKQAVSRLLLLVTTKNPATKYSDMTTVFISNTHHSQILKGKHPVTGDDVCLKMAPLSEREKLVEIDNEIQLMKAINHENVISFYGVSVYKKVSLLNIIYCILTLSLVCMDCNGILQ
jgi:hypothetical protein